MKKALSLILAALMLFTTVACFASCGKESDKKVLKVYTNAGFAPYEYLNEKNEVVGVDMDTVKYIADKLGYTVQINDIEFDNILVEVAKDELAVGAAGMTKKPERDEMCLATNVYATSVQYVIAPKGAFSGEKITMKQIVDYAAAQEKGKSIGDQRGTTGASMVEVAVKDVEGVSSTEYTNAIVASQDIGTTVSAVIIDKMPAESICKGNDKLECWAVDAETESYVMYFNKNATELVKQVNEILDKMIADGKIDEFTVNHSK